MLNRLLLANALKASVFVMALSFPLFAQSGEWEGVVTSDARYFFEQGDYGQDKEQFSIAIEPEYYHAWEDSDWSITFKPFLRWDSMDDERTHGDIRELMLTYVGDEWEFKAGIGKVFWGVAESQHLVDIINQSDFIENVDGEDKLGQPMLSWTTERDWGLLELYLLPGFRERTFAGVDGRLRTDFVVDTDNPIYAHEDGKQHVDGAVRWSQTLGDWDIGLSHFSGTSREPLFVITPAGPTLLPQSIMLQPLYVTIDQTSIDLQATIDAWLWKLEAYSRSGFDAKRYWAMVAGFEYSYYGITDSGADLGVIMEYQKDSRDQLANGIELDDTIVTGLRLAVNDEQSTEALLGYSYGENQSFINLEASRRLGDSWKMSIEARFFTRIDDTQPLSTLFYSYRNDDYIGVSFEKYF